MNVLLLPQDFKSQSASAKLSINGSTKPKEQDINAKFIIDDTEQVNHIIHVLKLDVGDRIKVGISQGNLGTAIIESINLDAGFNHVVLSNICLDSAPPPKLDLTVILALPRPKVLRRLIMDMTAIGVANIALVNSYRSQKSYWQSPLLKRLDEFVTAGLQQGVDTVSPQITLHQRFKPFVEDNLSAMTMQKRAVVAHPYVPQSFEGYQTSVGTPQIICIGAEGGWIDYEVDLLINNGCKPVHLGERILRTEAAVNVLCGRCL